MYITDPDNLSYVCSFSLNRGKVDLVKSLDTSDAKFDAIPVIIFSFVSASKWTAFKMKFRIVFLFILLTISLPTILACYTTSSIVINNNNNNNNNSNNNNNARKRRVQ